jgi:phospholipase C
MLRFIEARFNLPAMTGRDANADPLFDLFDFSHADTSLPEAVVDQTEFQYCLNTFPP